MKIRFGVGLGVAAHPDEFTEAVDRLEELGIDSLWLSEVVYDAQVEPFVGMAYALSRTTRLKVGTGVSILPGRNPVLVAKQLASLAGLAPGRVLPVFGLHPARPRERDLFPVPAGRRGAVFDEALELLRLLLHEDTVTFHGRFYTVEDAGIAPPPAKPLDIWLGGSGPAALRRVGTLADGWLASFVTPAEARVKREAILAAAAAAGREIEADHFGVSLTVVDGDIPAGFHALARLRRPDVDPAMLVADGWDGARRLVEEYIAAGLSKFVIRPAAPVPIGRFLDDLVRVLGPLEN
ncbi:MAG: TIGR03854 family LLM class F420-dependent oxidoreductase [Actinomadura sp.]